MAAKTAMCALACWIAKTAAGRLSPFSCQTVLEIGQCSAPRSQRSPRRHLCSSFADKLKTEMLQRLVTGLEKVLAALIAFISE